jgi:hypothetical protein
MSPNPLPCTNANKHKSLGGLSHHPKAKKCMPSCYVEWIDSQLNHRDAQNILNLDMKSIRNIMI